mmetsp:Transcript_26231/g.48921  ORF Transcript_26231/g.48921 Transcript_26231/m.48921 type:complete len:246 (+) Transcript_26231:605-1342(+)
MGTTPKGLIGPTEHHTYSTTGVCVNCFLRYRCSWPNTALYALLRAKGWAKSQGITVQPLISASLALMCPVCMYRYIDDSGELLKSPATTTRGFGCPFAIAAMRCITMCACSRRIKGQGRVSLLYRCTVDTNTLAELRLASGGPIGCMVLGSCWCWWWFMELGESLSSSKMMARLPHLSMRHSSWKTLLSFCVSDIVWCRAGMKGEFLYRLALIPRPYLFLIPSAHLTAQSRLITSPLTLRNVFTR